MRTILFRADVNNKIGIGHVARCISIAGMAKRYGYDSLFVTADNEPHNLIERFGIQDFILDTDYKNPEQEIEKLCSLIRDASPSALFIDSYFATEDYFKMLYELCKSKRTRLVYIDDLISGAYKCDFIIHYAVNGENDRELYEELYKRENIPLPQLLLGVKYAPLRYSFRTAKNRWHAGERINVLVTTGGSDVTHFMIKLLGCLISQDAFQRYRFHFVIGSKNGDAESIKEMAADLHNVSMHYDVTDMHELMISMDIAISAGGTTLLELCSCAVPSIAFTCAENQVKGTKMLCNACGMPYAGDTSNDADILSSVLRNLSALSSDERLRGELAAAEKAVVDGLGSERILNIVLN